MYFPDLHVEEMHFGVKAIKVGWLDIGQPYAKAGNWSCSFYKGIPCLSFLQK